jgi:two-component system KDP operon response regulator KdpE
MVDVQTHGTAALLALPFRPIRLTPQSDPPPAAEGGGFHEDLGDLVRRLEDVVKWLRTRRDPGSGTAIVRFGTVEIELATQSIRRNGERVKVTRTEFRLLYALMRRRGEVVSRAELAMEVWGPEVRLRSRAIDTHIARLRRKLEDNPAQPRHIHTAPYLGYRFDPRGG